MLFYKIKQGELRLNDTLLAKGLYSGQPPYVNDPFATHLKELGPVPVGVYFIGEPRDTADHGPLFIPLIPVTRTTKAAFEIYDRSAFGVHGERKVGPSGLASKGCIIAPHPVRLEIEKYVGGLFVVQSGNW